MLNLKNNKNDDVSMKFAKKAKIKIKWKDTLLDSIPG